MNYEEWLKWREEYFKMVKESDIFGGKQWSREEQFEDEMNSFKLQIKYTLQNYRKLRKGEWKKIQDFIEELKK